MNRATEAIAKVRERVKTWDMLLPCDVKPLLAVAEAAQEVSLAQRRMLEDWSESDELVRKSLWVRLHAAGKTLFDALDALGKVVE